MGRYSERVKSCWGGAILGGGGAGQGGAGGGWGGAIPGREGRHGFEAVGVADHLVQRVDNLAELGPVVAVLLPAVQHKLVQGAWAVHGWWQPIVLLYGINYLGTTQGLSGGGWVGLVRASALWPGLAYLAPSALQNRPIWLPWQSPPPLPGRPKRASPQFHRVQPRSDLAAGCLPRHSVLGNAEP